MKKNRKNDISSLYLLSPITKICSYCDEHKKLQDTWLRISRKHENWSSTYRNEDEQRNDFRGGESLVSTLDHFSSRRTSLQSSTITKNPEQNEQSTKLDSPTSCLKRIGKITTFKKRVNFHEKSIYFDQNSDDCYHDDDEYSCDRYSYSQSEKTEFEKSDSCNSSPTNSSSYYELPQCQMFKNTQESLKRPLSQNTFTSPKGNSSSGENTWLSDYSYKRQMKDFDAKIEKLKRWTECNSGIDSNSTNEQSGRAKLRYFNTSIESIHRAKPFPGTILKRRPGTGKIFDSSAASKQTGRQKSLQSFERQRNIIDSQTATTKRPLINRQDRSRSTNRESKRTSSSLSSRSLESEEQRLVENFNRMSLESSTCCCTSCLEKKPIINTMAPKVVKPKDALHRAKLRRMLVYPPEGQIGEPLTVFKKWSNIDCHVRGDSHQGFRYKVYYLQKFESDKWYPNAKTGSPFRSVDDSECSTDYH